MKYIAVGINSHRQAKRLPPRDTTLVSGLPITLHSKTRIYYYKDTPENRAALSKFKIHKRETERVNKLYEKKTPNESE